MTKELVVLEVSMVGQAHQAYQDSPAPRAMPAHAVRTACKGHPVYLVNVVTLVSWAHPESAVIQAHPEHPVSPAHPAERPPT